MPKLFTENPPKIYLKDSDKVRFADYRARIFRDSSLKEPRDYRDLVFEKAAKKSLIPANAVYKWKLAGNRKHKPIWFFTTLKRFRQIVINDPSYCTQNMLEDLAELAKEEKKLYQDWYAGTIYGYVVENWDAWRREWMQTSYLFGIYSTEDLFINLATETDGISIPICIDDEDMKYDFENVEMHPNEFA